MFERFAVRLDPVAAYPQAADLSAALAARDWPRCRTVLQGAGPADRTWLLQSGAAGENLEGFLRAVLAEDPADSTAAALLGFHLVGVGWRIRSDHRARYVSRRQFADFWAHLRAAEQVLIDAVAVNPEDPALWVARLKSARGLEFGPAETRRRYARLAALDPHHLPGQAERLQQLCPKWAGDWEQVHAFAREEMLGAPQGGPQGLLVVEGHLERWADLTANDLGTGRKYLASRTVHGEITEAARRSVFHPDFRRTVGWVRVVSTFAMAFSLLRDHVSARAAFRALGPFAHEYPWSYLGEAATAVRKNRIIALSSRPGLMTAADDAWVAGSRVLSRVGRIVVATGGFR